MLALEVIRTDILAWFETYLVNSPRNQRVIDFKRRLKEIDIGAAIAGDDERLIEFVEAMAGWVGELPESAEEMPTEVLRLLEAWHSMPASMVEKWGTAPPPKLEASEFGLFWQLTIDMAEEDCANGKDPFVDGLCLKDMPDSKCLSCRATYLLHPGEWEVHPSVKPLPGAGIVQAIEDIALRPGRTDVASQTVTIPYRYWTGLRDSLGLDKSLTASYGKMNPEAERERKSKSTVGVPHHLWPRGMVPTPVDDPEPSKETDREQKLRGLIFHCADLVYFHAADNEKGKCRGKPLKDCGLIWQIRADLGALGVTSSPSIEGNEDLPSPIAAAMPYHLEKDETVQRLQGVIKDREAAVARVENIADEEVKKRADADKCAAAWETQYREAKSAEESTLRVLKARERKTEALEESIETERERVQSFRRTSDALKIALGISVTKRKAAEKQLRIADADRDAARDNAKAREADRKQAVANEIASQEKVIQAEQDRRLAAESDYVAQRETLATLKLELENWKQNRKMTAVERDDAEAELKDWKVRAQQEITRTHEVEDELADCKRKLGNVSGWNLEKYETINKANERIEKLISRNDELARMHSTEVRRATEAIKDLSDSEKRVKELKGEREDQAYRARHAEVSEAAEMRLRMSVEADRDDSLDALRASVAREAEEKTQGAWREWERGSMCRSCSGETLIHSSLDRDGETGKRVIRYCLDCGRRDKMPKAAMDERAEEGTEIPGRAVASSLRGDEKTGSPKRWEAKSSILFCDDEWMASTYYGSRIGTTFEAANKRAKAIAEKLNIYEKMVDTYVKPERGLAGGQPEGPPPIESGPYQAKTSNLYKGDEWIVSFYSGHNNRDKPQAQALAREIADKLNREDRLVAEMSMVPKREPERGSHHHRCAQSGCHNRIVCRDYLHGVNCTVGGVLERGIAYCVRHPQPRRRPHAHLCVVSACETRTPCDLDGCKAGEEERGLAPCSDHRKEPVGVNAHSHWCAIASCHRYVFCTMAGCRGFGETHGLDRCSKHRS